MAPLDPGLITSAVSPGRRALLGEVIVLQETGSTNDHAMQLAHDRFHGCVVVADTQSAGKGRRGRRWSSPPGNLYMSLCWRFADGATQPGLLPLAAGLAVCRALASFGLVGHGLKWPNDVRIGDEKLCGILVEARGRNGSFDMVCGVGVNMMLDDAAGEAIGQPWTSLSRHLADAMPTRNQLAGSIVDELVALISEPPRLAGSVLEHWPKWDLLYGQDVNVHGDSFLHQGVARGVDAQGALRLETSSGQQSFHSGEVSVREA